MANTTQISRSLKIYLDGKEVTRSVASIRREIRTVRDQLNNAQIGSDEYRKSMERLKTLNGILDEHKRNLSDIKGRIEGVEKQSGSFFSKVQEWVKGGLFLKMGMDSFDALLGKLSQFRDLSMQKESSSANLQALTGLDDASIGWLTEQAEKLSTTMDETGLRVSQSSQEILEAYMLVGSAKPELLSDKEALNAVTVEAMRLAQAAKMDLKDAVDGVTLALNQYGAGAEEAAKYVNVLAAGSKAGSADVQSQTASIIKAGVAAATANVPIEQLVGSIETLAEKGIKGEVAGTGLKTFFLKLETMADDCRPSVVGLQTALENLAAKNMTTDEMMKAFGEGTYTVAQAMISSADSFRNYTAAVTDTSVAVEQAAINSDTAQVKSAQLQNQINELGMEIWESLAPAYNVMLEGLSGFLSLMPSVLSFIGNHIGMIATLVTSMILLKNQQVIVNALQTAWNKITVIGTTIRKAFTLQLNLSNMAMNRYLVTVRNHNALTRLAIAVIALFRSGMLLLSGSTAAAAASFKVFTAAISANPIGMIITGVMTAISVISMFISSTDDATESTNKLSAAQEAMNDVRKKVAESTAEERTRIEALTSIIHDNSASYDEKKKAIASLQQIVPAYQATLSNEGVLLRENAQAIEDYLVKLDKMSMAQAAYEKITELNKKILENSATLTTNAESLNDYVNKNRGKIYRSTRTDDSPAAMADRMKEYRSKEEFKAGAVGFIEAIETAKEERADLNKAKNALLSYIRSDSDTYSYYNNIANNKGTPQTPATITPPSSNTSKTNVSRNRPASVSSTTRTSPKTKTQDDKRDAAEKRVREELEKIAMKYDQRMNEVKDKFKNGQIASEREYNTQLEDLTIQRLQEQLKVTGISEEKQVELLSKLKDIYVRHKSELNSILADIDKSSEDSYNQQLARIAEEEEEKMDTLRRNYQLGMLSEQEFQDARTKIIMDARKQRTEAYQESKDYIKGLDAIKAYIKQGEKQYAGQNDGAAAFLGLTGLSDEIANVKSVMASLTKDSPEYQALEGYLDNLENTFKTKGEAIRSLVTDIGASIGTALGEAIASNKQGAREALKSLVMMVIDAIEQLVNALYLVPMAEAVVPGVGWGKALATMAQIAAVKIAFAAVKAGVSSMLGKNYYTGGYTGNGRWDDPRGVVHAGEFVANRFAVANPAVRPVLDLIDAAQRSGNIRSLSADDITAVATPVAGRAGQSSDPEVKRLLAACTSMLRRVDERFAQPIHAYTTATGKYGTMEAERLVEQMRSNSQRKLS